MKYHIGLEITFSKTKHHTHMHTQICDLQNDDTTYDKITVKKKKTNKIVNSHQKYKKMRRYCWHMFIPNHMHNNIHQTQHHKQKQETFYIYPNCNKISHAFSM